MSLLGGALAAGTTRPDGASLSMAVGCLPMEQGETRQGWPLAPAAPPPPPPAHHLPCQRPTDRCRYRLASPRALRAQPARGAGAKLSFPERWFVLPERTQTPGASQEMTSRGPFSAQRMGECEFGARPGRRVCSRVWSFRGAGVCAARIRWAEQGEREPLHGTQDGPQVGNCPPQGQRCWD